MIKLQKNAEGLEPYGYPPASRNISLKLDYNEPTFPPSPKVMSALDRFIKKEKLNWYPEGRSKVLLNAISKYAKVKPSQIIVGNGSDELLLAIAMAYLEQGDEVIIPTPNYAMFYSDSEVMGAKVAKVLLENLQFKSERIIEKMTEKTKIIYLSNPQAIIGTKIPREDIIRILKAAANSIVIVDEAYFEYCQQTVADLIEEYDNLIVTRTFSKAFSLASLRLGYLITDEKNIAELSKVKDLLPESVNSAAQIAGIAALDDLAYFNGKIASVVDARTNMTKKLRGLGLKVYDSAANYILVDFGKSAEDVFAGLVKKGILVRDVSAKPLLSGCLRFGIPLPEESQLVIDTVREVLLKLELDGKDTILFDMDGVLVDVSNSYRLAIKLTAEYFLRKTVTFDQIQSFKQKGSMNNDWDCTQAILKDNGKEIDKPIIITEFERIYGSVIDNERQIIDPQLLDALSKKFKLGLVTGRPRKDADYTIDKFRLRDYFRIIVTLDDVKSGKPDPEGIAKALGFLKSDNAIYIGDTVDDINAAKGAGIQCIAIGPAEQSGFLKGNGAKIILEDINQMEVLK